MDLKNRKPAKIQVKWPAHGSPWPTTETPPDPETKEAVSYNSVTEAIFRELYRRYDNWRNPPRIGIHDEITAALAAEITREIDKEILNEIRKQLQVPKDKL